jgi:hypothetical protein
MREFALAALLLAGGSAAATLSPSDAEIADALEAGAALINPDKGYPLRDHLLLEVPDARDIKPAWGAVDAVILATPLERARHAGYLAKLSGQTIEVPAARQLPELHPGSLSIIVYTHGPDGKDESFIDKFGRASLVFPHETVAAAEVTHTEPNEATYPLAGFERQRQAAVLIYRFDLAAFPRLGNARCRLKFTDPTGKAFDIPLNLAQYR